MFNSEPKYDIQKLIQERQEPMQDLRKAFDEIRQVEEEKRRQKEAEELAALPPKPLTTDEQIQLLTKSISELTLKMGSKGEEK